ncbi:MAG TPA: glycosyltransferase family 4 protein [Opitutaceae bacterium]|nr:glycosyltransferase family 4 protein [Opitutaceae bacterium]
MILFTHPTGNANVRYAALGLHQAGLISEFWTCLNYRGSGFLEKILPRGVTNQLKRRTYPEALTSVIHTQPFHEVMRLLAPKVGLRRLVQHEKGRFSVDAVYRALDRAASRRLRSGKFSGVYAYEDGAEFCFRAAKERGVRALYDLPIGYWRAAREILLEEAEREPEWAVTLSGNQDSREKTERKDAELAMADVVYVASSYTRKTLESARDFKGKVVIVPYGSPTLPPVGGSKPPIERKRGKKLRVLFVGSLGQRKGLSYLFSACRQLEGAVELTIIGQKPLEPCAILDRELSAVRWLPTCPHQQVLAEMAAHDVFVFPSLFEGFGLVLLEAMAMGLPVITTAHTAGPDLIRDGVEGFIVPIRSSTAIAERLELLHREPLRHADMSECARLRAREFSWETYGKTLAACVAQALGSR